MVNSSTQKFILIFANIILVLYRSGKKKWILIPFLILLAGMFIPQKILIPVKGATTNSWNKDSFWHYPWGKSITHKGVDIFADFGTEALASTYGLVVYTGSNTMGGNSVIILGPKWRFHYYAHLQEIQTFILKPVSPGAVIGTIGDTGNAKGKPPHLHYTISTPIPFVQNWDESVQGWKKMFYLNPDDFLRPESARK